MIIHSVSPKEEETYEERAVLDLIKFEIESIAYLAAELMKPDPARGYGWREMLNACQQGDLLGKSENSKYQ